MTTEPKHTPKFLTIHHPDYNRTFTYSVKCGNLTFDDGNALNASARSSLDVIVEKINREHTVLVAVAEAAKKHVVHSTWQNAEVLHKAIAALAAVKRDNK